MKAAIHAGNSRIFSCLSTRARVTGLATICACLCGPLQGQTWTGGPTGPIYYNGGNVGVGTTSPSGLLHIYKNQAAVTAITVDNDSGVAGVGQGINFNYGSLGTIGAVRHYYNGHWNMGFKVWNGAATEMVTIQDTGNVGIGTTAPAYKLDVAGDIRTNGLMRLNNVTIQSSLAAQNGWQRGAFGYGINWDPVALNWAVTDQTYNQASLQISGSASLLYTAHSGPLATPQTDAQWHSNDRFYVGYDGNVGIGTVAPQYKLAVNGTIGAKEVIVTTTGWSDYVFKPDYRLRPLKEIALYIKANHHLPEIPSEAEVQGKGISLGEIQAKLLAKVEELTLHMIQAEERNDRLEQANEKLKERLARLEGRTAQ
jgi:hypothetical protein